MKSLHLLGLLVILLPHPAQALVRIKLDSDSANGRCLPPVKGKAKEILARNRVQTQMEDRSPVPEAVNNAVAEVIDTIGRIGDGRFRSHQGVTYVFGKRASFSFQEAGTYVIQLNPGNENRLKIDDKRFGGIMNRGVLAHELGHYVSNRDGFAILNRYMSEVPNPCYLTNYARDVYRSFTQTLRMEEFAEVFAAYVTNPGLLAKKSPACERARRFVSGLFAEKGRHSESCAARKASLGDPAPAPAAAAAAERIPLPKPRPHKDGEK